MLLTIILATLVISLLSFVGLFFINHQKERWLELGISLAVGAMLGAVFLDILPEIFESAGHEAIASYSLIILLSIFGFFLVERLLHWHHCQSYPGHCSDCEKNYQPMGWINIFGDGLHNFVDGGIIAASFLTSWHLGIIATVAIALHEIPQEIGDFSILLKAGFSRKQALLWNFISGLLAVAGGCLTLIFAHLHSLTNILLSIAVGSFLYLAMSDIIPQLHHSERKNHGWQLLAMALGVALIYFSGLILPHGH